MDRPADPAAVQLTSLLASHGLSCRVTDSTQDRGGFLDIAATRDDLPTPSVNVIDVGLSDHRLLRWSISSTRPPAVYTTTVRRPWRKVDVDDLRAAIMSSRLGCPDLLPDDADVDTLATMYDAELSAIVDRLTPASTVTVHCRSSDPWFDDKCRTVKRSVRLAELLARRCPSVESTADWQSRHVVATTALFSASSVMRLAKSRGFLQPSTRTVVHLRQHSGPWTYPSL